MGHDIFVPILSYDQLREEAARFLRMYHASGEVPVPIEDIIDVQLRIDIISTPGLRHHFDVDAYITSDMESIYVDEFMYQSRPSRYRLSLAHEIAHAVLHQKTFRALHFKDIDEWKCVQERITDEQHGWLEYQAYAFAGLVLVPPGQLLEAWDRAQSKASAAGISITGAGEAGRRIIANWLAQDFDVSPEVVERRMLKDGLWQA